MGAFKELLLGTEFHAGSVVDYTEILVVVNMLKVQGIEPIEVYNPKGLEFRITIEDFQLKLTQATDSIGSEEGLVELQFGGMTTQEFNRYGARIGRLTYQEAFDRIVYCYNNKTALFQLNEFELIEDLKEKMNRMRKPFEYISAGEIQVDIKGSTVSIKEQNRFLNIRKDDVLIKSSNKTGEVFNFLHLLSKE